MTISPLVEQLTDIDDLLNDFNHPWQNIGRTEFDEEEFLGLRTIERIKSFKKQYGDLFLKYADQEKSRRNESAQHLKLRRTASGPGGECKKNIRFFDKFPSCESRQQIR